MTTSLHILLTSRSFWEQTSKTYIDFKIICSQILLITKKNKITKRWNLTLSSHVLQTPKRMQIAMTSGPLCVHLPCQVERKKDSIARLQIPRDQTLCAAQQPLQAYYPRDECLIKRKTASSKMDKL